MMSFASLTWTGVTWVIVGLSWVAFAVIIVMIVRRKRTVAKPDVPNEYLPPIEELPTDDVNSLSKLAEHCRQNRKKNQETLEMTLASMRGKHVPHR